MRYGFVRWDRGNAWCGCWNFGFLNIRKRREQRQKDGCRACFVKAALSATRFRSGSSTAMRLAQRSPDEPGDCSVRYGVVRWDRGNAWGGFWSFGFLNRRERRDQRWRGGCRACFVKVSFSATRFRSNEAQGQRQRRSRGASPWVHMTRGLNHTEFYRRRRRYGRSVARSCIQRLPPEVRGDLSYLACFIDFIDCATFQKNLVTPRERRSCNPGGNRGSRAGYVFLRARWSASVLDWLMVGAP